MVALGGLSGGATFAGLGAGDGRPALLVVNRLGPRNRFFLTEIDGPRLELLRRKTAHLPAACCALVYLRRVYHHFENSAAAGLSLNRSLQTWRRGFLAGAADPRVGMA